MRSQPVRNESLKGSAYLASAKRDERGICSEHLDCQRPCEALGGQGRAATRSLARIRQREGLTNDRGVVAVLSNHVPVFRRRCRAHQHLNLMKRRAGERASAEGQGQGRAVARTGAHIVIESQT